MALKSPRFASNARLQSASNNTPTIRFGEKDAEAVHIIQKAYIDLGFPMPVSTMKAGSPDGIFGTETASVTRSFQTKHKLSPDGIVGRDTLAKLDDLFPATPTPEKPPEQPASTPREPSFTEVTHLTGFDARAKPLWQMVPARGGERRIHLLNGRDLEVVSTIPSVVTVKEVPGRFIDDRREFILRGDLRGRAFVQARKEGRVRTQIQVGVKALKKVSAIFHFVSDDRHATTRKMPEQVEMLRMANDLLRPQANVEVSEIRSVKTKLKGDFGDKVLVKLNAKGEPVVDETLAKIIARRDPTADANVFFLWDLDPAPGSGKNIDGLTARNAKCIFLQDALTRPWRTLAHEFGHFLGLSDVDDRDFDSLMCGHGLDSILTRNEINRIHVIEGE